MKSVWLTAGLALLCAGPLHAADTGAQPSAKPNVQSKIEMHEKMAQLHKQVADCLRSGKAEKECDEKAMKECPMARTGQCPFMSGMKKGQMKDHMHMKGMMEGDQGQGPK